MLETTPLAINNIAPYIDLGIAGALIYLITKILSEASLDRKMRQESQDKNIQLFVDLQKDTHRVIEKNTETAALGASNFRSLTDAIYKLLKEREK